MWSAGYPVAHDHSPTGTSPVFYTQNIRLITEVCTWFVAWGLWAHIVVSIIVPILVGSPWQVCLTARTRHRQRSGQRSGRRWPWGDDDQDNDQDEDGQERPRSTHFREGPNIRAQPRFRDNCRVLGTFLNLSGSSAESVGGASWIP